MESPLLGLGMLPASATACMSAPIVAIITTSASEMISTSTAPERGVARGSLARGRRSRCHEKSLLGSEVSRGLGVLLLQGEEFVAKICKSRERAIDDCRVEK